MADCCKLVGNLSVSGETVFSIQVSSSTEAQEINGVLITGPTLGTINLSAYASFDMHVGCPGSASVSIDYLYKYDCDNDVLYILYEKAGKGTVSGEVGGLASVSRILTSYDVLNASAAAGPASLYEDSSQTDGFGLKYTGLPFSFDTDSDDPIAISVASSSGFSATAYLKSFSLQCSPGQLPVANYSLLYTPMTCVVA